MQDKLTRRDALTATGVAIALPFLESTPVQAADEHAAPPQRLVLICSTLGLHSPSLFPKTAGKNYETTEYLDILKEHRDDFTLYSGLSHPDQHGKEPHDTEMTFLSAARNPGLGGFKNSISVDQVAATALGQVTRFRSLSLSSNGPESQSYTSNGVMIPAEQSPARLFSKLFLTGNPREVRRQRNRLSEGRSILDLIGEQAKALNRNVSNADKRQLNEYFSAIRDAELELKTAESWLDRPKPIVDAEVPTDIANKQDLIGRADALFNLIPLILQTDSSRIITMVIQDHLVVPTINGVSAEHHNLSHHGRDPEKIKQLKIIEKEILRSLERFLSKMRMTSESDQRLLDNTSVLFGSNLGNANAHDPRNLPIILAGGRHNHGRYVAGNKENNTPLCNLFVSLLNSMGVETDEFATSDGSIEI